MHRRPWSLVFLALFNLIVPIVHLTLVYLKMREKEMSAGALLQLFTSFENMGWLLHLTIPSLVAAGAIYAMKKWSYPIFMLSMAWIVGFNISNFDEFASWAVFEFLLVNVLNIGLVSFFLIPAVREVYFNPRLRWWESATRYKIQIPITVEGYRGMITDISKGGLFLTFESGTQEQVLTPDSIIHFSMNRPDLVIDDKARVAYKIPGKEGYGLEFKFQKRLSQESLKHLLSRLKQQDVPTRGPQTTWQEDLKQWLRNAPHQLNDSFKSLIRQGR